MNKKLLIIIIAGAIFIIAIIFGCPGPNTNNTLSAEMGQLNSVSTKLDKVDIYYDASVSMRGYFAGVNGQLANIVSRFDRIAEKTTRYTIGKNGIPVEYQYATTDLQDHLALFNGGDTRFDIILPQLAKKSSKGKMCLFVTDGIVFVNKNASNALEEFQNNLAKALKNTMDSKSIAIFKYSAPFHSPQVKKGGICYFDMNDTPKKIESDNRPFYVIAIGNPEDILFLQTKIDALRPELQLYFGIDPDGILQKGQQRDSDITVNSAEPLKLQMTLPTALEYEYNQDKDYFLHKNTHVRLEYKGNSPKELKDTTDYHISMVGNHPASIVVEIAKPDMAGDGILTFETKNSIPTVWDSLSINDDSNPNVNLYRNKTFGLLYLIRGIMDATGDSDKPLIKYTFKYNF